MLASKHRLSRRQEKRQKQHNLLLKVLCSLYTYGPKSVLNIMVDYHRAKTCDFCEDGQQLTLPLDLSMNQQGNVRFYCAFKIHECGTKLYVPRSWILYNHDECIRKWTNNPKRLSYRWDKSKQGNSFQDVTPREIYGQHSDACTHHLSFLKQLEWSQESKEP